MKDCKSDDNIYKIIFCKNDKFPIGFHSRNLISKIKDKEKRQNKNQDDKNENVFNPISDDHSLKIQKLYTKFQTIKSATKYNRSFIKKKNLFLRPFSQNTTYIGLNKINSCPFFKITPKTRPISQLKKDTTTFMDVYSYNYSKISKMSKYSKPINKNNIIYKNPRLLKKKTNKKRNVSALLINRKNELFNNSTNSQMKELLRQEDLMKKKKKELKARLLTALSKDLVINKNTLNYYNEAYKSEEVSNNKNNDDMAIINKRINKKKVFNYIKHTPYLFSKIRPPLRYEDYYYSPLEFLSKYFTKEELVLLKSSPEYFNLNKCPFKNSDFEFNPTLLSRLVNEENIGVDNNINVCKNKRIIESRMIKDEYKKEMNKIKKIFTKRKINKKKREPIKGKDFVSHYERDIEPDEGTVQFFERKYIKYLSNKQKRMEKKIYNIKYKKEQFEFLKNEHTQKIEEEKNVQRITGPIINVIKKNYLRINNIY